MDSSFFVRVVVMTYKAIVLKVLESVPRFQMFFD